jgi:hypothetical protein
MTPGLDLAGHPTTFAEAIKGSNRYDDQRWVAARWRKATRRVTVHNAARLIRGRRIVGASWTGMVVVVSVGWR